MTSSTVVAFPGSEAPQIQLASVCSPGVAVSGSRNNVWLCPAYAGAYDVMLYVKPDLSVRQIVAELVVAQVGMAMGLPVATPYLVAVGPHHVGRPRGPATLAFGSQQMGARSTARVVRNLDLMLEMLRKAKAAEGICVLDELSANSVRHERDMVFDPLGAVWLIDHEAAFPPGLAPDEAVTNWLAERLKEQLDTKERLAFLSALRKKAAKPRALPKLLPPFDLQKIHKGPETWRAVVDFLSERIAHLDRLLSERVVPEQSYLDLQEDRTARRDTL